MSTATTAKERPILFSAPMVRAILEGRKTQARRIMKPQPERHDDRTKWCPPGARYVPAIDEWAPAYIWNASLNPMDTGAASIADASPYGRPGDRLWVRETWALVNADEDGIDDWVDRGGIPDSLPWPGWQVWHRAGHSWAYDHPDDRGFRWRPSIHMPRWASRITLEITGVRVERLQDIGEADAAAEGIAWVANNYGNGPAYCDYGMAHLDDTAEWFRSPIDSFRSLWESINGKDSWGLNPWVWVIEFRRLEAH